MAPYFDRKESNTVIVVEPTFTNWYTKATKCTFFEKLFTAEY